MLRKLRVQNYAIIDKIEIDFSKHLNIITGETGAGKSILMGALNLILGERSDSSVLQNKDAKCVVEGVFSTKNSREFQLFFRDNDLDLEDELLLRREIGSNGKSRSFINDTPVNLVQLKALACLLVDLHQQFETVDLTQEDFQREVIDAVADNGSILTQLNEQFTLLTAAKKQLSDLQTQQLFSNKELDYNRYLFEELDELNLQENELESIETELKLLNNAENVKLELGAVYFDLVNSEQPLVQQVKQMQQKLAHLNDFHPEIAGLHQRLAGCVAELQDIAEELEKIDEGIQYDAEKIAVLNDRMNAGYKLLKKHGVAATSELMQIKTELQGKLDAVMHLGIDIETLQSKQDELQQVCSKLAADISQRRKAPVKNFTQQVNDLLAKVGMPNARLKIDIQPARLTKNGSDEISFLFDANKSNRFEPLQKVASGGELSRLMLSIKSLVAKKLQLPTLIFDEIDTGISGEAARQVGIILQDLSNQHQVICITHQPQIAAKATAHFFVYKEIVQNKIATGIRKLNNDERITTLAKMLSGEKPSAAALENAREMLVN